MPNFRPLSATKFINDASLVSYWPLDGNSNDAKGSNNGTDTSVTYGTSYVPYVNFGQGANYNGSAYTDIGNPAGLQLSSFTYFFGLKHQWLDRVNLLVIQIIIHPWLFQAHQLVYLLESYME